MTTTSLVELDAKEFGQHVKLGGWRLGLLVARNVELGAGQGARTPRVNSREVAKVSAKKFGQIAGVGEQKVRHYLAAWDRAALDLDLPTSDELLPGNEIDLDEEWIENHPWGKYYSTVNKKPGVQPEGTPPEPEQQAREFRQAITSNPEFAQQAREALNEVAPEPKPEITPEQVREAVRSNPEIEEAAKEETFQRMRERAREHSSTYDPTVPAPEDRAPEFDATKAQDDRFKFMSEMKKAKTALTSALFLSKDFHVPMDEDAASTTVSTLRDLVDQIEVSLTRGDMDSELAALLEEEV